MLLVYPRWMRNPELSQHVHWSQRERAKSHILGTVLRRVHGCFGSKYELSIGKISNLHISHMF